MTKVCSFNWIVNAAYVQSILDALLAHYKKCEYKEQRSICPSSKEIEYEESCLCGSYSYNGHLSRKPIIK
jgi:hypothetical protein